MMTEVERLCGNCAYWIDNGGFLHVGYCRINDYGYRKKTQTCKKWIPDGATVMKLYSDGCTPEQIAKEFALDANLVAEYIDNTCF